MSNASNLIVAMAITLGVWAGIFLLLVGLGAGLLRLVLGGEAARAANGWLVRAWTGFAALVAVLQLWHFFLPVDGRALSALATLSLIGWATSPPGRPRPQRWALAAFVLLALWTANRAIGPCSNFDSGNYHLPLISWFRDYPLPPGLANLNPLYGLNLAGLLFPALLEAGPGRGHSSHFANGFLLVLLFALLLRQLAAAWRDRGAPRAADWAAAFLLVPAVGRITANGGYWISSPATDMPPLFVGCAAIILGLGVFDDRRSAAERQAFVFSSLALVAILPALKATALVLAATTFAVWSWRAARRRALVGAVGFATLTMGAWLLRGVVLSGYPLLPLRIGAAPVDWRLPGEYTDGLYWWTQVWARTAGDSTHWTALQDRFAWIGHWARTELRPGLEEIVIPATIAMGLAVLSLWRRHAGAGAAPAWILAPLAVAVPAWFLTTPSARFGQLLFWSLASLAAAVILPGRKAFARREALAAAGIALALSPVLLQSYYTVRFADGRVFEALARLLVTPPGAEAGFHGLPLAVLVEESVCGDSLMVARPRTSFESLGTAPLTDLLPWGADPPATSFPLIDICPRRPGDLSAGFRPTAPLEAWSGRHAQEVRDVATRTEWDVGRLAVHFSVRPEVIRETLDRRR